jgi:hypothetical protein
MNPSARTMCILKAVATYYTLTRAMLQELCLPETGKDGCVARKILNELKHQGLINQTRCQVTNPHNGSAAPVYYPSRKGCELLAQETRDDKWLKTCTQTPNWQLLHHWTDVAKFHILLDQAIGAQTDAQVMGFLHEWDIANSDERDPSKRYKLFTEIRRQPRLVFVPDAGFLLSYHGYKKVYYVEMDRQTSGVQQIAASKTPGVLGMLQHGLHVRHFPETNVESFTVLLIAPTEKRRDALQRAISQKDGARHWKFAAWPDLKSSTLLYEPVLRDHEGQAVPFLKQPQKT